MGKVLRFRRHSAASSGSKTRKKSLAVTAPSVTAAIFSATSRDGQPLPSQSCVTRPPETPIRRANSPRLMSCKSRYSDSFMGEGFSPSKSLAQVKVLAPVHGQAEAIHRKFSMAKAAQRKRLEAPTPPGERVLQRTFIRQWRKKAGLSQTALGAVLGVSTATISQIENAETGYKQEYLEAIAEAVGCDPADLLVRSPDDPEPIWRLWDLASAPQRKQIIRVTRALLNPEVV